MKHVSATQITMFRRCPRLWFLTYCRGMKQPPTPAMLFGSKLHSMVEKYLLTGDEPQGNDRAAQLVRCGIDRGVLPPPGDLPQAEMLVEHSLKDYTLSGVKVRGFIDLVQPTVGGLMVVDHKTTSAWQWALRPEQLPHNVQLVLYADYLAGVYDLRPDDFVTLRHNQFLTRGSVDVRAVQQTVRLSTLAPTLLDMESTVDAMAALALVDDEAQARQCLSACDQYGGCKVRGHCYQTPYTGADEMATNPLVAKILARKKEQAAKAKQDKVVPSPQPPDAVQAAPMPPLDQTPPPAPEPEPQPKKKRKPRKASKAAKTVEQPLVPAHDGAPAPKITPQVSGLVRFEVSRQLSDGNYGHLAMSAAVACPEGGNLQQADDLLDEIHRRLKAALARQQG